MDTIKSYDYEKREGKYFVGCKKTKKLDFNTAFAFWCSNLLERCINVFKWKGLPFPQHEIEKILAFVGFCGVTKIKNSSNAFDCVYGSMTGVTQYPDIFTSFIWSTPIASGSFVINETGVVINASSLRLRTIDTVQYYAIMLTNIDLTLQSLGINLRATSLIKGNTDKQIKAIQSWYNALEDGKTIAVLDDISYKSFEGDDGIKILANEFKNNNSLLDVQELRNNILKDFYRDIGINSVEEKRERLIDAEVETGFNRVLFNISDMLDQRKKACTTISEMFNTEVSVEVNPEIVAPAQQQAS